MDKKTASELLAKIIGDHPDIARPVVVDIAADSEPRIEVTLNDGTKIFAVVYATQLPL